MILAEQPFSFIGAVLSGADIQHGLYKPAVMDHRNVSFCPDVADLLKNLLIIRVPMRDRKKKPPHFLADFYTFLPYFKFVAG